MSSVNWIKAISAELTVNASAEKVYQAWTTEEVIKSFFAPDCNIKIELMGPY